MSFVKYDKNRKKVTNNKPKNIKHKDWDVSIVFLII